MKKSSVYLAAAAVSMALAGVAHADDKAVQSSLKKSGCTTCHSVDKKKVGPSYKEVSAKYKGNADAAAKLYTHLTTGPKVMVDGKEEAHDVMKGSEADIKAVVAWILSR
jgi:cytochrome c